ncbi:EH domain-binding 1 1 isoform X2 [Brachionus plicatilis]|uniref:EH domain-binding 1 1 isoform X2 n=1 Tax=Brachionus plicatilis TaxID=10195 RepID=A0A3M7PBA3_BRAPC|nr:EH domain-binding 1 1 isoform X2 [Brachionus plicatilis]
MSYLNLINLNELSETDCKSNLKQAFNATDKESIVRVVDYADFLNRKNLDRLSIMTYLYQIKEKYDPSNPCAYNISPNSKTLSSLNQEAKVKNFSNFSATPNSTQKKKTTINVNKVNTLVNNQQITNSFFNPFDSDEDNLVKENKIKQNNKGIIEIKSPEETKSNHQKKQTADRKKSSEKFSKFLTPKSKTLAPKKNTSSEELIDSAKKLMERNKSFEENDELRKKVDKIITESKYTLRKPSEDFIKSTNPFEDEDENLVGTEYINQEIINLKQKQNELDEKGGLIEKQLRSIMKKTSAEEGIKVSEKDKKLEDKLLKEWFLLVNERNVLLHQQQELELLQNEKSLEKRYQILSDQLRNLMHIGDNLKTEEQKKTESVLFNELINLVNKRNELVLQLDEENKLLNEGECINEYIVNKSTFQPKESQCVVQ